MADLYRLVLSASFLVPLAVSAPSPLLAAVHGTGEGRGWTVPSPPRNGSGGTPSRWATRHHFHVGDVLDFKNWHGPVLVVRRGDYERCRAARPVLRFADGNATTRFMLGLSGRGLFYFIAAVPPGCEAGQRMTVRVAARYSSVSAPTPAPAPSEEVPDAPDKSVPSDLPWKKVAYVVLGFLAGGLFSSCCMFFFIRCCGNH